jgi:hypothetical protein
MVFLLLVQSVYRYDLFAGIGVLRSGVFGAAIAYDFEDEKLRFYRGPLHFHRGGAQPVRRVM